MIYLFFESYNEIINNVDIGGASSAPVQSAGGKAEEKPKEKPKEEEAADVDMGGLFGDEY
jgi:ribosomal protein L12E/L44/L45/RPP1/RPP2